MFAVRTPRTLGRGFVPESPLRLIERYVLLYAPFHDVTAAKVKHDEQVQPTLIFVPLIFKVAADADFQHFTA